MAEVSLIDIDGLQWSMKDQTARDKITNLEENNITKDLPDIHITLREGYEAQQIAIAEHYSYGKIHFALIRLSNIKGNYIGTNTTAFIASLNIYPKKRTTFLMYDYKNKAVLHCFIEPDGTIAIGESSGLVPDNNDCFGEIIFAEP